MIKGRKIFVASSATETGGPEALHHLVHELRQLGADAYISYLPQNIDAKKPERFAHYDAPVSKWDDQADNYVLLPENETGLVRQIHSARVGIWWLSVDNYFGFKHQSALKDFYVRFRRLQAGVRAPIHLLKSKDHFTQSEYARLFLARQGIASHMLGDALRSEFLQLSFDPKTKQNLIAFNPNKGQKELGALQTRYAKFQFVAIQNMTSKQVAELLLTAKVYVDFGHHPGKDRPPREAAMAGCCVITGRKGSAENPLDVRVPESYKLDHKGAYLEEFGPLVEDIFENYSEHYRQFDAYRKLISEEPEEFRAQVAEVYEPAIG